VTSNPPLGTGVTSNPPLGTGVTSNPPLGTGVTSSPPLGTGFTSTTTSETSAAPTSSPPPPYATGTCRLHLHEWSWGSSSSVYSEWTVFDGAGNPLASDLSNPVYSQTVSWGQSVTIGGGDGGTKLPYDLVGTFTEDVSSHGTLNKRSGTQDLESRMPAIKGRSPMVGPPSPVRPIPWQSWVVGVSAGNTQWTSDNWAGGVPYTNQGHWDNNQWSGIDQVAPVSLCMSSVAEDFRLESLANVLRRIGKWISIGTVRRKVDSFGMVHEF
jgi:hypothetical protein